MTQTLDKPKIDFDSLLEKQCECTVEDGSGEMRHKAGECTKPGKHVVTGGLTRKAFVVCEYCMHAMKVRG